MGNINLAAERAASQARQGARDAKRLVGMSPWMQYCLWLYEKYPNNPISLMFFDKSSAPRHRRNRVTVVMGDPDQREVGESAKQSMAWLDRVEPLAQYDSRIAGYANDADKFLFSVLKPEDTFEAWLATQEENDG